MEEQNKFELSATNAISELGADRWNALVADDNPFCRFEFLSALESSGCISADTGWYPFHLTLERNDKLVAVAPAYLKGHSQGEFVFDWAWADAYGQAGLNYYPKLLLGIPVSPVTGPRLMTGGDGELANMLIRYLAHLVKSQKLSSAHANFIAAGELPRWEQSALIHRQDIQFHWHNQDYQSFDDFLAKLKPKKRKNIRQERRKVAADGWHFEQIEGVDASPDDWRLIYDLYLETFARKGNWAVLNREFFTTIGESMPESLLLVFAVKAGVRQAGALFFKSSATLYGRYWGCFVDYPGLHFETCYYQGIQYCVDKGLKHFDPGAQGHHKHARGFLPTVTHSFHYIDNQTFDPLIRDAVRREREHVAGNLEYYRQHSPFAKNDYAST